jgi:hypothetical protein
MMPYQTCFTLTFSGKRQHQITATRGEKFTIAVHRGAGPASPLDIENRKCVYTKDMKSVVCELTSMDKNCRK